MPYVIYADIEKKNKKNKKKIEGCVSNLENSITTK